MGDDSAPRDEGPLSFDDDAARLRHRRDPDIDELAPVEPGPRRPAPQYGWLVGLVIVVVLVYVGVNTLRNAGAVHRGVAPGARLVPFAAPLAVSGLDGDANVATGAGQGQRGKRPACTVRGPDVVTVCPASERAPLVLAFVATREPRCADALDRLERARSRFPGVRFAAVAARTNRGALRRQVRSRGWGFDVAYDRDGAVFARYGIVDCPTITFSYPAGIAMRTTVKALDDRQLDTTLRRLVSGAERRGWKPPAPA